MVDRFELENRIAQFGNFSSFIRDLSHNILEHDLSIDETCNILEGIAGMIDNHERITFDVFKQAFNLDEYNEYSNAASC